MNNIIDKFFIYLESIFRGRLPIKYRGSYIIENIWVVQYECLSINPLNVDEIIKKCIYIKYSAIHKSTLLDTNDEDFKYLSNLLESTLKSLVTLDFILKNQTIFFNQFKLQDYSEYKSELRNSIINNLLT